jgi:lipoprotein NlpI
MTGAAVWEAFVTGRSEDAVIRFADLYAETGDQATLQNLGLALLDEGNYEVARQTYDTLLKHERELKRTGESTFICRGLVDWAEGRQGDAVKYWKNALRAAYVDDGGGVTGPAFLWFAAKRTDDTALLRDAEQRLEKFRFERKADWFQHWPGSRAVASFLLGEVDAETFAERWRFGPRNETLELRRRCRVSFWLAAKATDEQDRRKCLLAACADKRAILECEYAAAKIELRLAKE